MTVSHAHARNACAHEQSTNIESVAVQWHNSADCLLGVARSARVFSQRLAHFARCDNVADFFA